MRNLLSICSLFLFMASCASFQKNQTLSEKEFGVPKELADKYAVTNEVKVEPVEAKKEEPAPVAKAEPAKKTKGKKAKKSKKEEKATAPELAKKDAAKPTKVEKEFVWPKRWTMKPFLREGEHYTFDITYFGATAGNLDLDILPQKVVNNRECYHLRAWARTAPVFNLFYRLNDVGESFFDKESLVSQKHSIKLDESRQQRDLLELYDQKNKKVFYWSKWEHKTKGKKLDQFEFPIPELAQDGLSSFFYVRTLPLEIGKSYQFPVGSNGSSRIVQVTAVRKETIVTKIGERNAIVVKPEVVLDGALTAHGDSFLWISDDEERLVLKVDAKIKIGSVIAYLREHNYAGAAAKTE